MSEAIIVALITGVGVTLLREGLDALKHKRDRKETKEDGKDEARLKALETANNDQREMNQLMLEGIMLITGHLVDGNHTDKLREYSAEVDEYLRRKI